MKATRWTVCIAAGIALVACSSTSRTNVGDGGSCTEDGECTTKSCLNGFCAGAHCTCNVLGECYRSGDCAAGWVCPDANLQHGGTCQRDCASNASLCPKGSGCVADGTGMSCLYGSGGPSLAVAINGSSAVEHGTPLVYHADVTSAALPISIEWTLVDIDTGAEKMALGTGPDLTVTLKPSLEVDHSGLRVRANDANGASGNQTISISFGCTSAHAVACDPSIPSFCCNATCDPATLACP